ncbi:hypothetical protein Anas_02350 [Armadillidium nasatum]|uniref:MARVEL domain-containing protein n=1 Tax=Armadillidium nasatum TaxID=96803 RepID=A0A5N5TIL1_9CRUS|nr:hypothetical protein Anas_02350 [Armadillidium nasatum]
MSRVPVSPVHYTGASARPVFIQPSQFSGGSNSGGFTCLCCTICPCIHLGFLRTVPGLLKIIELEVVFNVVACFLYLSSASHLSWAVQIHVLPNYLLIPGYAAYPAMTACYVCTILLFIL